jgi:hypothetical protein
VRAGTEFPQGDPFQEGPGETDSEKVAHLYKLISNLSMAVNQHAVMINKQQVSQKKFVEEQEVISHFDTIAESISLYDEEFIKALDLKGKCLSLDTSKYDEETDNKLTNKTHKICNKVIHLGHACYYLYRRLQQQKKEHDEYREIVNQTCIG